MPRSYLQNPIKTFEPWSCGGCKMYPGLSYSKAAGAATETVVLGVAPQRINFEGSEMVMAESRSGCKCGASCARGAQGCCRVGGMEEI